jgi:hypothetical protein
MAGIENGLHQRLMDEAYSLWESNPKWSKIQLALNVSPMHRAAVVLGNLNYQVENGGFSQWLYNGYGEGCLKELLLHHLTDVGTEGAKRVAGMVREVLELDPERVSGEDTDDLDDEYYTMNDQFMVDCEEYLKKLEARKAA